MSCLCFHSNDESKWALPYGLTRVPSSVEHMLGRQDLLHVSWPVLFSVVQWVPATSLLCLFLQVLLLFPALARLGFQQLIRGASKLDRELQSGSM